MRYEVIEVHEETITPDNAFVYRMILTRPKGFLDEQKIINVIVEDGKLYLET